MKKIFAVFLSIICLPCFFSGCKKQNELEKYVSELRSDVFFGESESFKLKAGYGFKESPYENDGIVRQRIYILTFRLLDKETDDAAYTLNFVYNGEAYQAPFKLNPVSHAVSATLEINGFTLKEFTVTVSSGAEAEEITLKSALPEQTIDYVTALDYLKINQPKLVQSYTDENGNFTAEIYARAVVKDDKAYWYIGLASGGGNLKAFLIDGANGEILAVREIF